MSAVTVPTTSACGTVLWGGASCALRPPPEVTHVCSVAKVAVPLPTLEGNGDEEGEWLHPDGRVLRVLQLDLWDDPSMVAGDLVWQRSTQLIGRASRWVQAALAGGACAVRPGPLGKADPCVLVNCHAGRNRSAAVLMARELLFDAASGGAGGLAPGIDIDRGVEADGGRTSTSQRMSSRHGGNRSAGSTWIRTRSCMAPSTRRS